MTEPDWQRCADDLPPCGGTYLLYDEREQHMWMGIWRDGTRHIEADQEREQMGWVGCSSDPQFWPTHWAERPSAPTPKPKEREDERIR